MTLSPSNTNAVFLPTTINYPKDPAELINRLNKAYEDTATRLNVKQIGIFDLVEFLTGEQWFTAGNPQVKRQTFRIVFSIGAIAVGATSVTAHNLTNITAFTHIYGAAVTAFPDNRPIPYSDTSNVNNQISITVDTTNINIKNGSTAPNISSAVIILEYLKN